jgi:hypothetical protein
VYASHTLHGVAQPFIDSGMIRPWPAHPGWVGRVRCRRSRTGAVKRRGLPRQSRGSPFRTRQSVTQPCFNVDCRAAPDSAWLRQSPFPFWLPRDCPGPVCCGQRLVPIHLHILEHRLSLRVLTCRCRAQWALWQPAVSCSPQGTPWRRGQPFVWQERARKGTDLFANDSANISAPCLFRFKSTPISFK